MMNTPISSAEDIAVVYVAAGVALTPLAMVAWPNFRSALMRTLRKRAALVICVGSAIAAASFLFGDPDKYPASLFDQMLGNGIIAGFGLALVLLGTYFWLAEVAPSASEPKI
jgi:hypothetical protein